MKQLIFIIALLLCYCSLSAQLKVKPSGYTMLGSDYVEDEPDSYFAFPGFKDTTTMLKIYGPGIRGAHARLSFGDQYYNRYKTVVIGELDKNNGDTDKLWLHGMNGFALTWGDEAADTVMTYSPYDNGDMLHVYTPVNIPSMYFASDSRFKEDIRPVDDALETINALNGVSYLLKGNCLGSNAERNASLPDEGLDDKFAQAKQNREKLYAERAKGARHYGFVAQEVEKVLPELVHTGKDGYKYIDYISVVPLLVNAVQQLQAELNEVSGKQPMKSRAVTANDDIAGDMLTPALYQNAPNPFTAETVIRCDLPESVQQAMLYVYDMQGKQIKSIPVNERGTSSVTIQGSELAAGMYIYALIADGREIDSKRMILTK